MSTDETAEEARLTALLTDRSERVTELEHRVAHLEGERDRAFSYAAEVDNLRAGAAPGESNDEWAARVTASFVAGWDETMRPHAEKRWCGCGDEIAADETECVNCRTAHELVAERKVLAAYTRVANEHGGTIEEARRIVVTLRPTFNVTLGEMAAALVAVDEAMRDLTGEVGMT